MSSLANSIRAERARRRISQARLAKSVGCSKNHIVAIEAGRTSPTVELLERIAAAFGVSPCSLIESPQRALSIAAA